ncbi:MAG: hypothetical protein P1V97_31815 [Planctomycetota bacterium]|nr:hypothetical protein [Planctomycetota bacterium]
MTVREDLVNWIESDLVNVTTVTLAARDIYQGQLQRNKQTPIEIKIRHARRININSKVGSPRSHEIELTVTSRKDDKNVEQVQSDLISDLADEIVERYDGGSGGLARFKAGLGALKFERLDCVRRVPKVNSTGSERNVFVDLSVLVWE